MLTFLILVALLIAAYVLVNHWGKQSQREIARKQKTLYEPWEDQLN